MKKYIWKYRGYKVISIWRYPAEIKKKIKITQASGICFNKQGRVLVIKNGNKWHLPGGHPLPKEKLLKTLKREIWEEACIKIKRCLLLGYSEIFFPKNPNKLENKHFYQARYACLICKIGKMRKDPATGILFKRRFIHQKEFTKYIKWNNSNELIIMATKKLKNFF